MSAPSGTEPGFVDSASDAGGGAELTVASADRLGVVDLIGLTVLGLLPVALAPGFYFPSNPRQALLIAVLPVGALLLGRMIAIGRDRAATAAALFLVVAMVSALRSDFRTVSLVGTTATEISVLVFVAAFGWWAIGRHLTARAVAAMPIVLTVSAAVNVLVGLYQLWWNPSTGLYQTFGGRMSGLTGNPVFFASTFVGLWVYWFVCAARSTMWGHLALTASLAASVALTGSRGAIAVGLLFAVATPIALRNRAALYASSASLVGIAVGFITLTYLIPEQTERLGDPNSASGLRLRVELWKATIAAWGDRPLLGWGPNPYVHELNAAIPESMYRDFSRLVWLDPHNAFLLVLVTTGVVGACALGAFLFFSVRGEINAALLGAAVAIGLSWMLQPVAVPSWPIAFALLGAAVRPATNGRRFAMPPASLLTVMAALGVAVALLYSGWSIQFRSETLGRDPDMIDAQAGWLISDPEVSFLVARFHKNADASGSELDRHLARAEQLTKNTVDLTSTAKSWAPLVEIQVLQRDFPAARATAEAWADTWPNDPAAFQFVSLTARLNGDLEAESEAQARLCEIWRNCGGTVADG